MRRHTQPFVLTVLAILILIIGPAIFFVGMLANEALGVSESVGPWIQTQAENPEEEQKALELHGVRLEEAKGTERQR